MFTAKNILRHFIILNSSCKLRLFSIYCQEFAFQGFVYSLPDHADHADVALELWRQIGIRRAHLVAHDMGDSILTFSDPDLSLGGSALSQSWTFPAFFCGAIQSSDAVSPMEIPKYLAQNVIPFRLVKGVTMRDTGHFLMLERPDWAKIILDFVAKSKESYVEKNV